jgi:hypothetical protein
MAVTKSHHLALTQVRVPAYELLFGCKPSAVFPSHTFNGGDETFHIDVFVYPLNVEDHPGPVVAAVTNGMSDVATPGGKTRRELLQYFPACDEPHARRLYECAWLPLFDQFALDEHQTITWPDAPVPKTPFKNSLFLPPLWEPHRGFRVTVEDDPVSFLWHVPLTDRELTYKTRNGVNALLDRMEEADLPWVFEESNRPPLFPGSTTA